MKLYISGPMTGIPNHNFPVFKEVREHLRANKYEVVCPAELGQVKGWDWETYLRRDLAKLLDCDGIAFLDYWQTSRGARLEMYVAGELGMDIRHWQDW